MYKIVAKRQLADGIFELRVEAPLVARAALPGQFVIVRLDETGERIPLTIADYDAGAGTVTIVVQVVGATTEKLCRMGVGEAILNFTGPLGHPSELVSEVDKWHGKRMLFVAGGVGAAPVYPQAKWLCQNGIQADVIIGARTKDLLIYTDEMAQVATVHLATDDGSAGFHGQVTGLLKELAEKKSYDLCVVIGPMVMMKFVALETKKLGIPTVASLNTLMVDGTGMCGACRVSVGGETKFTCVDGPEFDAHAVDFDEAMRRQTLYRTQEATALENLKKSSDGH